MDMSEFAGAHQISGQIHDRIVDGREVQGVAAGQDKGNYWKTEAQIEMFYNGMMSQFRGDYTSPFVLGETRGGTLKNGSSIEGVSLSYPIMVTNRLDKDNTGVSNWNGYYSRILQVNHYIEQVRDHCEFLSDADRNAYLAPGYGLRAYYYFMLYKTFSSGTASPILSSSETHKLLWPVNASVLADDPLLEQTVGY